MTEISICMPCYNVGKHIGECIDSVLNQTFFDFEFINVDDGSTDQTVEIIKNYSDIRIRLIENEHNYIQSLNTSIRMAEGKYIARMDSDDVMMPDRLLIQYNYLEHQNNIIAHPTMMIRKSAFEKIPVLYEENYKYAEDNKLWMTMLAHGLLLDNIPDILIKYRVSQTQIRLKNRELMQKTSEIIKKNMKKLTNLNSENIIYSSANMRQLVFEVTDACNLKCKYCAYGKIYDDYDARKKKMSPIEKAIRLIDYLVDFRNSERNTSIKQKTYLSFYGVNFCLIWHLKPKQHKISESSDNDEGFVFHEPLCFFVFFLFVSFLIFTFIRCCEM